ncbi:MAG: hypothetical protein A49_03730 [Methyloceanibacter sp.]|nr:MAG: hypothetical protein A49_03730 [Methyloceanibacter sp.]
MKRKHKVVVELTFDGPLTAKDARCILQAILDGADKERIVGNYLGYGPLDVSVEKAVCKEGERVVAAERQKGPF